MFSLKLNIFSIILSFTKQLVIYFTVSSKVIHSRVITGTVPLKQPGARCFAQGHNHRLNWERIDGKCFQFNGEKMIGSLMANPFYFICVCCSLIFVCTLHLGTRTIYHLSSVGYDGTSLSFGGFKLTSPDLQLLGQTYSILHCIFCFFFLFFDGQRLRFSGCL